MKTAKQITKAINEKMPYALDFISISNGSVEVYVERNGELDFEATQAIKNDFVKNFGWGGFRVGYGAWILQKEYSSNELVSSNID